MSRRSEDDAKPRKRPRMTGVCMADVVAERVEWLWPGRIPLGKITVLDGDPGLGKSTLTCALAAAVTMGVPIVGDGPPCPQGSVILLSGEDGHADTIRPRLDAAGADARLVLTGDEVGGVAVAVPDHVDALEEYAREHGAKLIVIDPLMAYLPTGLDAYKDQHVRSALTPLAKVLDRLKAACVIVRHLSKDANKAAMYRGGGSIGITGAARSVLVMAKDPDDPDARVLAAIKSNLGPSAPSLKFRLVSTPSGVARIRWEGESTHHADALLAPRTPEDVDASTEAASFLRDALAAGPVPSTKLIESARAAGHSQRTLERAKDALGLRAKKGPGGTWRWSLPEGQDRQDRQVRQAPSVGGVVDGPDATAPGVLDVLDVLDVRGGRS